MQNELIGKTFNLLTVISTFSRRGVMCNCQCSCGNQKIVSASNLRLGQVKSCGCLKLKHGLSNTPTYYSWTGMLSRCLNPKAKGFEHYGGRGIRVCNRWINCFANFVGDMGVRPSGCTLDRIDTNGDYTPENCRWANGYEQGQNKRNTPMLEFEGDIHPLPKLAHRFGLSIGVLAGRIKSGWTVEEALATPVLKDWQRRGGRPKRVAASSSAAQE